MEITSQLASTCGNLSSIFHCCNGPPPHLYNTWACVSADFHPHPLAIPNTTPSKSNNAISGQVVSCFRSYFSFTRAYLQTLTTSNPVFSFFSIIYGKFVLSIHTWCVYAAQLLRKKKKKK